MNKILSRIASLDGPTKVLWSVGVLIVVITCALSALTHKKSVELAARPVNCTVDADHYKQQGDGTVTILKGAMVVCDRYASADTPIRFTVKKAG
ncbi:hypothetical protein [Paraburkholderia sp. GAS32]|uniref:hypothetical protein n=1 Tax=Paraburkholderia sp. GAS32 TaxID=3035129 RepID=UPI003D1D50C8